MSIDEINSDLPHQVVRDIVSCRSTLLSSVMKNRGLRAWTEYWNGLNEFILGKLSKPELDRIILASLSSDEGEKF